MSNNGRTKLFGDGADAIDLRLPQGAFGVEGFFDNANGGGGNDTIQGNGNDNNIAGGAGADSIKADFGNDTVDGGSGNDHIFGEFGADSLLGGDGNDTVDGGWDNDVLRGGNGNDSLLGDLGNDRLFGDAGADTLLGGNGNDQLSGGTENDLLKGGFDNDTLNGDAGNDTLRGEDGGDSLNGGDGNDVIFTDESGQLLSDNDVAHGGAGNDTITSFTGADQLFGDAGDDVFVYNDLLSNRMLTSAVRIDGGAGTDTVVLKGEVLPVANIGADPTPILRMWDAFTSVERIDIEQDHGNQTLSFGFRDIQDLSDTDVLTIDGNVGDQVNLYRFVSGDILQGNWVQGADQAFDGKLFHVFDFDPFGPAAPVAEIRIDADVGVVLL